MDWVTAAYKNDINNFVRLVIKYCKKYKLPITFAAFLLHGTGYVSNTYRYLLVAPKIFLANSVAFSNYYNRLDKDFKESIYTKNQLRYLQHTIINNDSLKRFLKKIQKRDALFK